MAAYNIKEGTLMVCPFDKTHLKEKSTMCFHIIKCMKQVDLSKWAQCSMNGLHWTPKSQIAHHLANCPDRIRVGQDFVLDGQEMRQGSYFTGNCSVPEYKSYTQPEHSGENWDIECDNTRGPFRFGIDDASMHFDPRYAKPADEPSSVRRPYSSAQVLGNQPQLPGLPPSTGGALPPEDRAVTDNLGPFQGVASAQQRYNRK